MHVGEKERERERICRVMRDGDSSIIMENGDRIGGKGEGRRREEGGGGGGGGGGGEMERGMGLFVRRRKGRG